MLGAKQASGSKLRQLGHQRWRAPPLAAATRRRSCPSRRHDPLDARTILVKGLPRDATQREVRGFGPPTSRVVVHRSADGLGPAVVLRGLSTGPRCSACSHCAASAASLQRRARSHPPPSPRRSSSDSTRGAFTVTERGLREARECIV
eukprot:6191226-Pleurochrysis_carterae.AAC.1